MIQKLILLFFFIISTHPLWSAKPLSKNAEISLLTCGPGDDLYSIFGHTAFRLRDDSLNWDIVFNYGTFDFSDDFYFQFAQGKLMYRLSIEPFESFYSGYEWENRWVREQVLALNHQQKQALFNYLDSNYRPENRYYLYHFFFNNCSTLPRDVLTSVLGSNFSFNVPTTTVDSSFRNIIDKYLVHQYWGDLGIDIGLGASCDDVCTDFQKTFLPDYLYHSLAISQLNNRPAVASSGILLNNNPIQHDFTLMRPDVLFWIFLLMMLALSFSPWKGLITFLDITFFSVLGLCGWLIVFLWFFTDHNGTQQNWNLVWAIPLHFPLIFALLSKKPQKWIHLYLRITAVLAIFGLLGYFALPQSFNTDLIPILLLSAIRATVIGMRFNPMPVVAYQN